MKYHRITGRGVEKELYDRNSAEKAADAHATHFLEQRRAQIRELRAIDVDPIVIVPFDAELFGHWWFEGPRFLELFIRKAAHEDLRLTTPGEFLEAHPTQQTIEPATSTWGDKGHLEVWLDQGNSWIYPHLHAAARSMTEIARLYLNIDSFFYWTWAFEALRSIDLVYGVIKPLVFGFIICMVSCYTGLTTTGGTVGVGRSTTQAMVTSSVLILMSDFFMTKLFIYWG